jgi:hypothetical protein
MPLRRWSLEGRFWSGPLLALSASCLWGCPQLLSDEFSVLRSSPDLSTEDPSILDSGDGTGGSAGAAGSAGNEPPGPLNTSGAGGAGGPPVTVAGAPSIVSVSPSNGATGIAANAVVTLTFSEPMNTRAVEAAYSSSDLPAGSLSFSWSNGDSVLQIAPTQPLLRATGTNPDATVARSYAFEIGTTATDQSGEALPRFSSSFSTLREITQTLPALQDRNLTGNWRSDDLYGENSCQFDSTTTCIGDSSNENSTYRGFLTFDLSDLPAQLQTLSAAQLSMTIDSIRNAPFAGLGSLVADHVTFDSISLDAFGAVSIGSVIQLSSSAAAGAQLSASVLSAVQTDLPTRGHSQFRLRFSTTTDADDIGDLIEVLWTTEQLSVTYLVP